MKKNILNVKGAKQLSKSKQRNVIGGSYDPTGQPCHSDWDCYPPGIPGIDGTYTCLRNRPWDTSGVCISR
ncbi:hypothetical protein ABW636_10735 [Aquimarina sp. 2201CG1-2-11]|uniref:hypothetical protein n=1 Tax=Aquimarina discodermiae TaxID=3231043 RepID=UPI0034637D45